MKLVAETHSGNDIDLAALSKTKLLDEGSLTENGQGHMIFWRGAPEIQSRLHGVGLTIRSFLFKSIHYLPAAYSERFMTVIIPHERPNHMTTINEHAPTLAATEDTKDEFYVSLFTVVQTVELGEKLVSDE